jgi:hypothetical protein
MNPKTVLRFANLPLGLADKINNDFSFSKTGRARPTFDTPTYVNARLFPEMIDYAFQKFGIGAVQAVNFAEYYLKAMEDRPTALKNIPKAPLVIVYGVGKEPVENKTLASSLLNFLLSEVGSRGASAFIVSEEMSGTLERSYGVKFKSKVVTSDDFT